LLLLVATTTTSTSGITFPEQGGPLPRAEMPLGGQPSEWRGEPVPPDEVKPKSDEPEVAPEPFVSDDKPGSKVSLELGGYLRVLGQIVENDDLPFVGRNDGFRVGRARIAVRGRYGEDLSAYVSIEGAAEIANDQNDPNATLSVDLRDAYILYELSRQIAIQVGRFKTPYDMGELESTSRRVFIDEPVESRGVPRTLGIETPGMSAGRQIGLMIGRDRMGLGDTIDAGFALALTNGKTERLAFNDNDRPAGFLRISGHLKDWVTINAAGFVDTRTVGELPNRFDEEVLGVEASLQVKIADLRIEGQWLLQSTEFVTTGLESVTTMGFHAQWVYGIWDLEVAYRFAWLDPNDRFDIDAVNEHTIGINYYPSGTPLRFSVNGTLASEERSIDNNRIDALAQFDF
jgi:hypothetical protein